MAYIQGRVQRCDNGNGISATLTDNLGNSGSADMYGFFSSYLAYPGYRLTATAYGYNPETHFVTEGELSAEWVTICMQDAPTDGYGNGDGIY